MKRQVAILSLLLIELTAGSAWADFKPKNPSRPKSQGSTAATRGSCVPGESLSLSAIAPRTIAGTTQDSTPTLAWFVPDSESYEMDLNLYAYEPSGAAGSVAIELSDTVATVDRQLQHRETMQTQQGLMQWTVPESLAFQPNQRYLWEVILYCNPNRPSEIAQTAAEVQLAEPGAVLPGLDLVADPVARSQAYAEAGLWYDAFAAVADGATPAAVAQRQALVESLLTVESELLEIEPDVLTPADLLIQPETDSALVRLAKQATRQLLALLEMGL